MKMKNEPIDYRQLKISTFNLKYIKKLKVSGCINDHTTLYLVGVLPEDKKDDDIHTSYNTPIEVYATTDEGNKTIYSGMITEVKIKRGAEYYELHIKALSYTYLMDIQRKNRSFQDINMSIYEMIRSITRPYYNGVSNLNVEDAPTNRLWIQYDETDWEFVKRVASYYNAGLYPSIKLQGVHYYLDTPELDSKSIEINEYIASKLIQDYDFMKENEIPNSNEIDYINYTISSYELLELGDHISFKNQSFYVSELTYEMKDDDGILENTYVLKLKGGQRQKRIYGEKLFGVSLEGTVIDVTGDKIKIKLDIDKEQDKETAYWFTYSTLAASPDGSGWYFMPELNDRVRMYFPTNDEKDAFSISCIQQIKGDPDVKYIATIYGKKIIFTKDSITITANNNSTIVLDKGGTISITGNSSISMNASESISLRAEDSITISGKNNVDIKCDKGGKALFDGGGNVVLDGTKVRIN
ncbi:contractile injection system protein, VgrG/Pvc8 family [Clostridium sp.]|uniref:contractile injection system protein, VgrG/Pvc8 family n=1 Tax=Clostridium sp. TaxID=1506 RepID=UPI002620A6E9|nr:contractile injection system protein, VgrG/Pvc8 family [Clostridium sp.]